MKAAIYNGKEDVVVVDLESPICGDNDIIIKNIYSSICGTDVAVFNHGPATGHKVTVGGEFGHETISEVAAVGKNVRDIKVGQRVYPYPILAKGDKSRAGTLGGFSEYILVPNAELNKQVYAVSDKISSKVGCLIEPFTIGNRAARRAAPKQGESAIVFGAGTIGIAVSIALQQFGCGKIESRIVAVAVLAGKRPVDILSMTYSQQALIGSGGYMPEDVRNVMSMMESGKYNLESIITHEFALKNISEAIKTAGKVDEALNVVIKF